MAITRSIKLSSSTAVMFKNKCTYAVRIRVITTLAMHLTYCLSAGGKDSHRESLFLQKVCLKGTAN